MDKSTVEKAVEAALPVLERGDSVKITPVKEGLRVRHIIQKSVALIKTTK